MNAKSVDSLVVLTVIVCIITTNVYCIENNKWANNQDQSDNIVPQEMLPDIQNFISAPDGVVAFNEHVFNDSAIDYRNNQFYPYPLSVNDVADNDKENGTAIESMSRRPQITSGFQMLRRSVATVVERIQYFIQSIWNYFTIGKSFSYCNVFVCTTYNGREFM